ncbi:surfactant protein Bb [Amia ocellicauda]|uniref:surfactant protein Bb n=1 Tax=Amia ocellicauda TaxID=2972642 RepID=UPI003464DB8D
MTAQLAVMCLCAALSSVLAGVVPQRAGCALGPEFWCQDVRSALQCGALQQCTQTVWKKDTGTVGNDSCKDCAQIFELLLDMLSNADTQEIIKDTLEELCNRLPTAETRAQCLKQVDTKIPLVINFLTTKVNPGSVCIMLGICHIHSETRNLELLSNQIADDELRHSLVQKGTSSEVQITPQCTFCVLLIKKLEDLLPKDRTEEAIVHLLAEVCTHLPAKYAEECQNFVNTYGKTVLEYLLASMAPHTICFLLHLCLTEESPVLAAVSEPDCEACLSVTALAQITLGTNATEDQTAAVMDTVCHYYPSAIPACKNFTDEYKPKLLKVLAKPWDTHTMCREVQACATVKKVPLLGENKCTWGPSYWCTDMHSASQCNAVEHCQAHVWK